jgi:hypothetical protein
VFRAIWARVRQFWTAEKWVRVTDDERNVRWLGLNLSSEAMAQLRRQAQANPDEVKAALAGAVGSVAELDCDIIIEEAPDALTPQIEQFQSLVELKKYDAANEIPFRAIVRAMPNLKDKQAFLKDMDAQAMQRAQAAQVAQTQQNVPAAQALQALQVRGAQAEVAETESKAALNFAKARDVERAHVTEPVSPFAAEVGEHGSLGPLEQDHRRADAKKNCGGSCSCAGCA